MTNEAAEEPDKVVMTNEPTEKLNDPTREPDEVATKTRHESLFKALVTSDAPQANREDTVNLMNMLIHGERPLFSDVFGGGPLLVSDIPKSARSNSNGVIMGIDEAGRGPVLGPMTYDAAYWVPGDDATFIPKGFLDSKVLKPEVRSQLFETTMQAPEIGFVLRVLHASEISRNMLRKTEPYNLNAMSHDVAIQMIRAVLDAGVKIQTCYIDTVGIASSYQAHLERVFSGKGVTFVVEKKADAKYEQCSAASVVAKVARDRMIEAWKWTENHYQAEGGLQFGSGYPSDPKCKAWLEKNLADPVFCFPDLVRFSWAPAKKALESGGASCEWEDDDDDQEEKKNDSDGVKRQQLQLNSFIVGSKKEKSIAIVTKKPRLAYFEKRGLRSVVQLHNG
jgi:ribonuclease H2 subunit A